MVTRLVVNMARRLPALGAQELAIMKVVWRRKDVSVRDVYETLRERRTVAYTTVMTMMNTLEGKGYLKKALDGRAYRYRPAIPERRVVTAMVREFVERVFDGSAAPLLAHLVAQQRSVRRPSVRNCAVSSTRPSDGSRSPRAPGLQRADPAGGVGRGVGRRLCRESSPALRLAYWRGVGALCLALPLLRTMPAGARRAVVAFVVGHNR